jgi:hypothetical protein
VLSQREWDLVVFLLFLVLFGAVMVVWGVPVVYDLLR